MVVAAGLCGATVVSSQTASAQKPPAKPATTAAKPAAAPAPPVGAKAFPTPQAAAAELIRAASEFDAPALIALVGPDGKDLVTTEDPVRDKTHANAFAALAKEGHAVVMSGSNSTRATLQVGKDHWPLPIPLVKIGGKWYFDSKAGREEVLYRRVGGNELDAIDVCRGYVAAQKEYALDRHDGSPVHQYAQRIISTPGKQDGLYWKNADGTDGGPIAESAARAIEEGYNVDKMSAYHGYLFHVLKAQGPAAPLGEMDYVINGAMIGGFALIATPAEYGVTGIQTFIVNHNGIVYQKDLGPDSVNLAKQITRYNPDKTWVRTNDGWVK